MDESIKDCKNKCVKGNLAISDEVPRSLSIETKFDLIFAFSIFAHRSEITIQIVMDILRKSIDKNRLRVITNHPKKYRHIRNQGASEAEEVKTHDKKGFPFIPHERPPIEGDFTYGDVSISIAYLEKNIPN